MHYVKLIKTKELKKGNRKLRFFLAEDNHYLICYVMENSELENFLLAFESNDGLYFYEGDHQLLSNVNDKNNWFNQIIERYW